jgi:hypothetical protein
MSKRSRMLSLVLAIGSSGPVGATPPRTRDAHDAASHDHLQRRDANLVATSGRVTGTIRFGLNTLNVNDRVTQLPGGWVQMISPGYYQVMSYHPETGQLHQPTNGFGRYHTIQIGRGLSPPEAVYRRHTLSLDARWKEHYGESPVPWQVR